MRVLLCYVMNLDKAQEFDDFSWMELLNCIWAINGIHLLIFCPSHTETKTINRKRHFSMLLQTWLITMEDSSIFMCSGLEVHNARIFRNSGLLAGIGNAIFAPQPLQTFMELRLLLSFRETKLILYFCGSKPLAVHLAKKKEQFDFGRSRYRMPMECESGRKDRCVVPYEEAGCLSLSASS